MYILTMKKKCWFSSEFGPDFKITWFRWWINHVHFCCITFYKRCSKSWNHIQSRVKTINCKLKNKTAVFSIVLSYLLPISSLSVKNCDYFKWLVEKGTYAVPKYAESVFVLQIKHHFTTELLKRMVVHIDTKHTQLNLLLSHGPPKPHPSEPILRIQGSIGKTCR